MIIVMVFSVIVVIYGQQVDVSSAFDTSKIYIGDQIKYRVTVEQPSDISLSLPVFKDTLRKNIEILSGPVIDSSLLQDGKLRISEEYLITSFDSGLYHIPPVYAELKNDSGLKRFYSDYAQLEVMRVKTAPADSTAKFFDIIKPYGAPITFGDILPWLLLTLLGGALIWLAIRYFPRLRRNEKVVETIIASEPAHIIAFRELEKLKEDQLWQKGEVKIYYTRLTEILRQYLENRFSVYSLELTTSETLEILLKSGFKKDESFRILKDVLTGADLVKFAKHTPDPTENVSGFQKAWNFIELTKEAEQTMAEVNVDEKSGEDKL